MATTPAAQELYRRLHAHDAQVEQDRLWRQYRRSLTAWGRPSAACCAGQAVRARSVATLRRRERQALAQRIDGIWQQALRRYRQAAA